MTEKQLAPRRAGSSRQAFWPPFVDQVWERKACLIPRSEAASLPQLDQDMIFAATVSACDAAERDHSQILRLYAGGDALDPRASGNRELMPLATDGDFLSYHKRVSSILDCPYGLIVTDWHRYSRDCWETICSCLLGLTDRVGVSSSRMDTQLFLGTYERTAFGVHVDDASGFHFPLIGAKRMRFWPSDYAEANPALRHSHSYGEFTDASRVIEAEPGDVIYWPSHYWHIGEGTGDFSLTWHFGYWIADGQFSRALAMMDDLDLAPAEPNASRRALPKNATGETLKAFAWEIIHAVRSKTEEIKFRDRVIASVLEQQSAFGFTKIPPGEPMPERASSMRLKFPFQIAHTAVTPDKRIFALAGRSGRLPDSARLKELIDALNDSAVVELPGDEALHGSEEIAFFLDFLRLSGAVET